MRARVCWILAVCTLTLFLVGCIGGLLGQEYELIVVVQSNQMPVVQARVLIASDERFQESFTNAQGEAIFGKVKHGEVYILVSHPDHSDTQKFIKLRQAHRETVSLIPLVP